MSNSSVPGIEARPYGELPTPSEGDDLKFTGRQLGLAFVGGIAVTSVFASISLYWGHTHSFAKKAQKYSNEIAQQLPSLNYGDGLVTGVRPDHTYLFIGKNAAGNFVDCEGTFLVENGEAVLPTPADINCTPLRVGETLTITQ